MSEPNRSDLRKRTFDYALDAIEVARDLPDGPTFGHLGDQMMRAATTVGAHYREASRARSSAEFTSKLDVAIQELEEARYWMALLEHAGDDNSSSLWPIMKESSELNAIFTTIVKKTKSNAS